MMAGAGHNSLRIIGGQWRGRKLQFPKVEAIRPTPDRVRETLFNWLAPVIHGADCLDLFAGSGALGFEALSRGAGSVIMCDSNAQIIAALRLHAGTLKTDRAVLLHTDACDFFKHNNKKFDLVFLDPPFNSNLLESCINLIAKKNCLAEDALVYVEASAKAELPAVPENWRLHRNKKAGDVAYYLFTTNEKDGT